MDLVNLFVLTLRHHGPHRHPHKRRLPLKRQARTNDFPTGVLNLIIPAFLHISTTQKLGYSRQFPSVLKFMTSQKNAKQFLWYGFGREVIFSNHTVLQHNS